MNHLIYLYNIDIDNIDDIQSIQYWYSQFEVLLEYSFSEKNGALKMYLK